MSWGLFTSTAIFRMIPDFCSWKQNSDFLQRQMCWNHPVTTTVLKSSQIISYTASVLASIHQQGVVFLRLTTDSKSRSSFFTVFKYYLIHGWLMRLHESHINSDLTRFHALKGNQKRKQQQTDSEVDKRKPCEPFQVCMSTQQQTHVAGFRSGCKKRYVHNLSDTEQREHKQHTSNQLNQNKTIFQECKSSSQQLIKREKTHRSAKRAQRPQIKWKKREKRIKKYYKRLQGHVIFMVQGLKRTPLCFITANKTQWRRVKVTNQGRIEVSLLY